MAQIIAFNKDLETIHEIEKQVREGYQDLIIPKPGAAEQTEEDKVYELTWTMDHSASSYGLGVLLFENGEILDGATFRRLRDTQEAFIATNRNKRVCGALGVPEGEQGIYGSDSR
jgi:hypothetical protein